LFASRVKSIVSCLKYSFPLKTGRNFSSSISHSETYFPATLTTRISAFCGKSGKNIKIKGIKYRILFIHRVKLKNNTKLINPYPTCRYLFFGGKYEI
jgi:hypothetical protein